MSQLLNKMKYDLNKDNHILENTILCQILAVSPYAILITDADPKIIYVNPAWELLTGYTFDEVTGKNPNILKSGKTPAAVYKKLWKALAIGNSFTSEEIIDKRKDGSLYNIHSTIYPVQEHGKIACYVQIQHDITEKVHVDKLKSEFLSAASHELKTPITVLKLLSQTNLKQAQKKDL